MSFLNILKRPFSWKCNISESSIIFMSHFGAKFSWCDCFECFGCDKVHTNNKHVIKVYVFFFCSNRSKKVNNVEFPVNYEGFREISNNALNFIGASTTTTRERNKSNKIPATRNYWPKLLETWTIVPDKQQFKHHWESFCNNPARTIELDSWIGSVSLGH